jgi:hypothetical protein
LLLMHLTVAAIVLPVFYRTSPRTRQARHARPIPTEEAA